MAPKKRVKITRDVVLFAAGLMGAAHEVLFREDVREGILFLLGGMMGLPAFLNQDEKRQEKNKPNNDDETPPASPTGG